MRKVTTTVAAALVAFSFAACNKTNNESVPAKADGTYAQLTFKEAGLRGLTDGQQDAAGTEGESKISNALFLTTSFTGNQSMTELTGFTAGANQEAKAYTSDKFLYAGATGAVESGLIVNGTGRLGANEKITLAKGGTTMEKYAKNDGFLMSSVSNFNITINPNVKKEEVADGNNRFRYTVERVAAKLQVAAPTTGIKVENLTSPVNNAVSYVGDVKDTRYAVAGGAMESFIFGDKAGSRTLAGSADPMKYTGFESAINSETATSGSGATLKWRKNIQKVSDLVAWTNLTDADFATLNSLPILSSDEYKKSVDNGIFFLENSINQTGGFLMHDVAHAKIYATFAFKDTQKVYTVDNGQVVEGAVADVNTDREDAVKVSKEWMDKNGIAEDDADITKTGTDPNFVYTLKVKISKGSFFVGDQTGKVYLTLSAARLDGNKTTRLFKNGKMYWEVPANKQPAADGKTTGYCDTRRNNIYSLNVKTISGLGDNWDNSDPTDPNIPKPDPKDNPDEPEKPDPKPVDPVENYIQVEAVILQWNLVDRAIDLK